MRRWLATREMVRDRRSVALRESGRDWSIGWDVSDHSPQLYEGLEPPLPTRPRAAAVAPRGFDPAWLFLIAGLAILAAAVLLPAIDDTHDVEWQRDRALAIEGHRKDRLERYGKYLAALDRGEPDLVEQLAAGQLNLIREDRALLEAERTSQSGRGGESQATMVFAALEPAPLVIEDRQRVGSMLEEWTGNPAVRPWLIAFGGVCTLVGLMPPASRKPIA